MTFGSSKRMLIWKSMTSGSTKALLILSQFAKHNHSAVLRSANLSLSLFTQSILLSFRCGLVHAPYWSVILHRSTSKPRFIQTVTCRVAEVCNHYLSIITKASASKKEVTTFSYLFLKCPRFKKTCKDVVQH